MEKKQSLCFGYETRKIYFVYGFDYQLNLRNQLNLQNIINVNFHDIKIDYTWSSYFKSLLYGESKNTIILTLSGRIDMFDFRYFLGNLIHPGNRVFMIILHHEYEDTDSLLGDADFVNGLIRNAKNQNIDTSKLTILTTPSCYLNDTQLNFIGNAIDKL